MRRLLFVAILVVVFCSGEVRAQSTNATVTGYITDPAKAVIVGARVTIINVDTNVRYEATTNGGGSYDVTGLLPGRYRIEVEKPGFKTVVKSDLVLHVQDTAAINFEMAVGSASEIVTVTAGGLVINTTDATVSTVVDRQFAENLPMNGRSFQTLIELTPGVVLTTSTSYDSGQFSVNGQRASSNYWMVDGVGANTGVSTSIPGNGLGGALGTFSVLGGTNSLVSVDAMQEFRIQTSTYAPEFGRTPGAQISIATRSGTSQFHGTAFDYFRNDVLDASNWFNGAVNPPLPKAKERQNDFGGTLGGPLLKDRTFFFFSYEGLRLRLPQTKLTTVPDVTARQSAVTALQPFLNAYPLPNGSDNVVTGVAQFNASYSDPASLDAYSLRIDHNATHTISVFGRYNYSPSSLTQRGSGSFQTLSTVFPSRITTQTATLGATWTASPAMNNDLRFNYSRVDAASSYHLDNFGGAIPPASIPFPNDFSSQNAFFQFAVFSLRNNRLTTGKNVKNLQRQINIVDGLTVRKGTHDLKFGVDFRRLSPSYDPSIYSQQAIFRNVAGAENGTLLRASLGSLVNPTFLFRDLGLYAQDTWRISNRLTLTYGLRWDIDFVPKALSGPPIPGVTGFNLNDLSGLALAHVGAEPYNTAYGNVAPRIGLAFQVSQHRDWNTVLRGGFGVFYDLRSSELGNLIDQGGYPYAAFSSVRGTFPLSTAAAAPPTIAPPDAVNQGALNAIDPNLRSPYTLQWNLALEQGLGKQQSISATYLGSTGRRLLQTALILSPNANFGSADLVTNAGTSNYNALQLQFQRRLSAGLQILSSYTWSHSIDTASAGSFLNAANSVASGASPNANRGPSDFDIRNTLSAAITYDIPVPKFNAVANNILGGWSLDNLVLARSSPPADVSDIVFFVFNNGFIADVRPDLVSGQPLYLFGSQCASTFQALGTLPPGQSCPGGKGFNPNAFSDPPTDPLTGNPTRQGTVPRNFLRGFGAVQWDLAIHKDFRLHESTKLQFRAEMFNVLNHPNFGQPSGSFLSLPNGGPGAFGLSTQMLGQSLGSGNVGGGGLSPLYQIGGPRSIQFALKLSF